MIKQCKKLIEIFGDEYSDKEIKEMVNNISQSLSDLDKLINLKKALKEI